MCDAEVYEPRQEAGALSIASNSIPVVMPPIVIVMPPAMPPTVADPIDRLDCPLIRNRAVFRLINQQRVTDCCGGRRFGWNPAQQRKHHQRRNQKPYHGIFSIRS